MTSTTVRHRAAGRRAVGGRPRGDREAQPPKAQRPDVSLQDKYLLEEGFRSTSTVPTADAASTPAR
jgi:hypothetical protein